MYKGDDDEEPNWVSSEREQFNQYRDKDKDGFMDRDEVIISYSITSLILNV